MNRTAAQEKGVFEPEHLEIIQRGSAQLQPTHSRPQDEAEKKFDRRVNLKLDFIVVSQLAVVFIVSQYIQFRQVPSLSTPVLRYRQDQRRVCCDKFIRRRRQLVARRNAKLTVTLFSNLRSSTALHGHPVPLSWN